MTDPSGAVWHVRRRWIPHRSGIGLRARFRRRRQGRRQREGRLDALDGLGGCLDPDGLLVGVALVVGFLLAVFVGWPLLLLLGDLVWLLLASVLGVVGRVVLGRPWHVEAVGPDGMRRRWKVKGYRAAGRRVEDVARLVALGVTLHPDELLPL